jgi:hypothetical protein
VKEELLVEYLEFVFKITNEAENPSIGLMMDPQKRTEEYALTFLHKMNYSLTKAKFYLLFPSYYHFETSQ